MMLFSINVVDSIPHNEEMHSKAIFVIRKFHE